MKKTIALLICLMLMFSMTGCLTIPVPESNATKHTQPVATEEPALQEGYCWVYGSGMELVAFAQLVSDTENLSGYSVYDFNGDGLGELILQEHAQEPVVYQFFSGTVLEYPAENITTVITSLPLFSGNDNFDGLTGIYSEQTKTQIPVRALFTKVQENLFTNGRETFATLSDGTVLRIDTAVPSVQKHVQLQSYEHILGVTKNSVYVSRINMEIGIGSDIYSLDRNGNQTKDFGIVLTGSFVPGTVLIQQNRTDVSPAVTNIYNNDDDLIAENLCSWGHTVYNGAIYCTDMDEDLYGWESTATQIPMKLLRVDSAGVHVILELTVPANHYATLYDSKLVVTDFNDLTSQYYDLLTGQPTAE